MRAWLAFAVAGWLLLTGFASPPPAEPFAVDGPRAQLIDAQVQAIGYPRQSSLPVLSAALVKGLNSDHERIYALYRWVSRNIDYDVQAYLSGQLLTHNSAQDTFTAGLAVCDGFSALLAEMARHAGLEVVVIEGLAKGYGLVVNPDTPLQPNHAWNAVKLDGRWQLLDATWDAGGVDHATRQFVRRQGPPVYFLADPEAFSSTHFPMDSRWQLTRHSVDFTTFAGSTRLTPQLRQFKLDVSGHTQEKIQVSATPYRFHFGPQVQRMQAGLLRAGQAVAGNWSLLVWGSDGRPDLWLSAPAPGAYEAVIYGASDPQAREWAPLLKYSLVVAQTPEVVHGFPTTYAAYYQHQMQLSEPLSGQLRAGQRVRIDFKAELAHKAAVFHNGVYWSEIASTGGRFMAELDALPPGDLSVGVMGSGDSLYQMVLGYRVAP